MRYRRRLDPASAASQPGGVYAGPRYLVVDRNAQHSDSQLPPGVCGKLVASFHTPDLAYALVSAEEEVGRTLAVLDSITGAEPSGDDAWPNREGVPAWSGRRILASGRRER